MRTPPRAGRDDSSGIASTSLPAAVPATAGLLAGLAVGETTPVASSPAAYRSTAWSARERTNVVPGSVLSAAQLGVWNAQRLDPDSRSYLVGEVLEISGPEPIDVALLAEAVRAVTDEAETLRLRFTDTPGGPRQSVTDEPAAPPAIVDLRAERNPVAVAHALVDAERARASEACRGMVDRPLHAYTVVRLTDRDVWIIQLYHHLIVDGYRRDALPAHRRAHYTALVTGTPAPRAPSGRSAT